MVAKGLRIRALTGVGGGKHTRLTLEKNGHDYTAMWFGHAPEELDCSEGDFIDIFCTITEKKFHQRPILNVTVRSIRFTESEETPRYRTHYLAYRKDETPLPEDCKINRSDMVSLYRYLTATALRNGNKSTLLRRPETIIRTVRNRYATDLNYCKLMLCLDTMQELGLIQYSEAKTLFVTVYHTDEKVDLCKAHDWDKISSADKG